MTIKTVSALLLFAQKPDTSVLSKSAPLFQQPHYLESLISSISHCLQGYYKLTGMTEPTIIS
jgi:hypothetical protein